MKGKLYNWKCPNLPIDIVAKASEVLACCSDGVYSLNDGSSRDFEMDFDDEDDDIFMTESKPKKPCPSPSSKVEIADGDLKVKFKREALSFCLYESDTLLSLHNKSDSEFYIEATDLENFHCINPNLCMLRVSQTSKNVWMMINDKKLAVHCYGSTFIGTISNTMKIELKPITIKSKLELFSSSIFQRPPILTKDIVDRIVDSIRVEEPFSDHGNVSLATKANDVFDINFLSHELVLVVLQVSEANGDKKRQLLQYLKNGKDVLKTEIPISHVSMTRKGLSDQGCLVMTTYGAVYALDLPFNDKGESDQPSFSVSDPIKAIMEGSKRLQKLNTEKYKLQTSLNQLKLALEDKCDLKCEMSVDNGRKLLLRIYSERNDYFGPFWSIKVTVQNHNLTFPFPMRHLKKDVKWTLIVPLDFELTLSDLPLSIESSLIFKHEKCVRIEQTPWLNCELISVHFAQIKSSLLSNDSNHLYSDQETFEEFLENLNAQSPICNLVQQQFKSVIVNLKLPDSTSFKFLETTDRTVYIDILGVSLTLNIDKSSENTRITIRGRDIDQLLRFKADLLSHFEPKTICKKSLVRIINLIEDEVDDNETDEKVTNAIDHKIDQLDLCYKYLRQF